MSEEKYDAPAKTQEENRTPKDEARDLLDAYAKTLEIWKVENENYFKRVQVAMGIIQISLFVALFKMVPPLPTAWPQAGLPMLLSILGAFSSYMWIGLNVKQSQYLEFSRRTLRNIEKRLSELRIPLEYFTLESLVFGPMCKVHHQPYSAHPEVDEASGKNRYQLTFQWSGEKYPEPDSRDRPLHSMSKVAGGMVLYEKRIAYGGLGMWLLLLVVLAAAVAS